MLSRVTRRSTEPSQVTVTFPGQAAVALSSSPAPTACSSVAAGLLAGVLERLGRPDEAGLWPQRVDVPRVRERAFRNAEPTVIACEA